MRCTTEQEFRTERFSRSSSFFAGGPFVFAAHRTDAGQVAGASTCHASALRPACSAFAPLAVFLVSTFGRRPAVLPAGLVHHHLLPAAMILSIASLTVKLAALARGGNSLKLSRYCATTAWAGTSRNARCACQSPYNMLFGPRSNGSDRTLYSMGARSFRKLPCQTPSGVLGPTSTCCSMNETFQLRTRSAMRSPSSLQ